MRIQFQMEGGIAYFPGLSTPVSIDTEQLSQQEAATIEDLVRRSGFFHLPEEVGAPGPGAADYRVYTITVDEDGQSHTVRGAEPVHDPALQALIDRLQAVQQENL